MIFFIPNHLSFLCHLMLSTPTSQKLTILTLIRYPTWAVPFAILSMAIFRLPLWWKNDISFWKLLGTGRNGTFDKLPEWQQWGILITGNWDMESLKKEAEIKNIYGGFISSWLRFFKCECYTLVLEPLGGHGKWDGKMPFGETKRTMPPEGVIAVITRASIRWSQQKRFWEHVDTVANEMAKAEGFITSVGIGETPFFKQATFSIWKDMNSMKKFAYELPAHKEVIKKTRDEKWYSEDLFYRFKPLFTIGSLRGTDPIKEYLPSLEFRNN
jgi:hypothetical protein